MSENGGETGYRGRIFDIKRFAVHDGPGIRTTVFLKGCSLRCRWCHNPESQSAERELMFRCDRCVRCGRCAAVCTHGAVTLVDGRPVTDRERCTGCGDCVATCPARARSVVGVSMTVAEALAEIEKDTLFYDQSSGGVTLSGGEPLDQPGFARALLRDCRALRIHTALDTSGYAKTDALVAVAEHVDLFLYDIKLIDNARHLAETGVSNRLILENLRVLDRRGERIWLRLPLVPGINDDAEALAELKEFVATLRSVEALQILPYHRTGEAKLEGLGRDGAIHPASVPSLEAIDRIVKDLHRAIHRPVTIGG